MVPFLVFLSGHKIRPASISTTHIVVRADVRVTYAGGGLGGGSQSFPSNIMCRNDAASMPTSLTAAGWSLMPGMGIHENKIAEKNHSPQTTHRHRAAL